MLIYTAIVLDPLKDALAWHSTSPALKYYLQSIDRVINDLVRVRILQQVFANGFLSLQHRISTIGIHKMTAKYLQRVNNCIEPIFEARVGIDGSLLPEWSVMALGFVDDFLGHSLVYSEPRFLVLFERMGRKSVSGFGNTPVLQIIR